MLGRKHITAKTIVYGNDFLYFGGADRKKNEIKFKLEAEHLLRKLRKGVRLNILFLMLSKNSVLQRHGLKFSGKDHHKEVHIMPPALLSDSN
ncbi:hypothetical protein LINPERPRIM_LOCUS8261 [Linum perenne]